MFPTKRSIAARIDALEADITTAGDRLEVLPKSMLYADEPRLTVSLASRGFVVEREPQTDGPADPMVRLQTTPSLREVSQAVLWHTEGPTAVSDDVRIAWDDDRLAEILAAADAEVVHDVPDLPDERVVVAEGEGWEAVAPADRVVETMILRRSAAENADYEIRGPVPPWVDGADEYDLVEVDADPVPYADRHEG